MKNPVLDMFTYDIINQSSKWNIEEFTIFHQFTVISLQRPPSHRNENIFNFNEIQINGLVSVPKPGLLPSKHLVKYALLSLTGFTIKK